MKPTNGTGFQATETTSGFGLLGMRERAELLHGTLNIESTSGHGTTITASLPADRRQPSPAPPDQPAGERNGGG